MSPVTVEARRGADRVAVLLGDTIHTSRLRRRWTLRELAQRSGVSLATAQHVEAGGHASLETYAQIGDALALRLEAGLVDPRQRDRLRRDEDLVHAAMGELEAAHFRPLGFDTLIDEPYQHYQFAGRADVVVVDRAAAALLHIENRTRFPNLQEAIGSYNAKRAYLGAILADRLGVRRWASETHVLAGAWTSEVLHTLRLRSETFRAVCPDSPDAWRSWWEGTSPDRGRSSCLVVLDPAPRPGRRSRRWIDLDTALGSRPRYSGYAGLVATLNQAGIGAARSSR